MKGIKKLLTGILAATLVMGASITAFATEADTTTTTSASITITNENNNTGDAATITYTYYQILKADVLAVTNDGATQEEKAAYYVKSETLADLLEETNLFTVTQSSTEERWNVELKDSTTSASDIVAALNTDAFKKAASATNTFTTGENGKATSGNIEPGYYLILSSLGTTAAVQTLGDVTINEKNTYPTVTKEEDKDTAQMFDTIVTYTVTVAIPSSVASKDIVVYDTATDGLTLDTDTEVTATVNGEKIAAYTWTLSSTNKTTGPNTYSLTIPKDTVTYYAGSSIVLTYTAVVNENAKVLKPEENTAYIEYDNYTSAKTEPAKVVTLGFNIVKVDGNDDEALTGAEFTLWDSSTDGNQIALVYDEKAKAYRVAKDGESGVNVVVDENGKATIIGLDATTYYLQEEVAPTGYNKLTARQEVVISSTTALEDATVQNFSGSVLPSTGGIGTTIFYIVGGILIVAGVAYFMLRRKSQAE